MPLVTQPLETKLAAIWQRIQACLLPGLEECLDDPLTRRLQQLIAVLEVVRIEEQVGADAESVRGRPRQERRPIARAFVAKAVYSHQRARAVAHHGSALGDAPSPA